MPSGKWPDCWRVPGPNSSNCVARRGPTNPGASLRHTPPAKRARDNTARNSPESDCKTARSRIPARRPRASMISWQHKANSALAQALPPLRRPRPTSPNPFIYGGNLPVEEFCQARRAAAQGHNLPCFPLAMLHFMPNGLRGIYVRPRLTSDGQRQELSPEN